MGRVVYENYLLDSTVPVIDITETKEPVLLNHFESRYGITVNLKSIKKIRTNEYIDSVYIEIAIDFHTILYGYVYDNHVIDNEYPLDDNSMVYFVFTVYLDETFYYDDITGQIYHVSFEHIEIMD